MILTTVCFPQASWTRRALSPLCCHCCCASGEQMGLIRWDQDDTTGNPAHQWCGVPSVLFVAPAIEPIPCHQQPEQHGRPTWRSSPALLLWSPEVPTLQHHDSIDPCLAAPVGQVPGHISRVERPRLGFDLQKRTVQSQVPTCGQSSATSD